MRVRIIQKGEVSKHFNCSIRNGSSVETLLEGAVTKTKHYSPIAGIFSNNFGNAWYTSCHVFHYMIKNFPMVITEILRIQCKVIS